MFKKNWTFVVLPFNDALSKALAETWNSGESREWFWTERGAERAALFHSMMMPLAFTIVHHDQLEEALDEYRQLTA